MKIIYEGNITTEQGKYINSLAVSCNVSFDMARLLYCRKIDTVEKVNAFLNPSKSGFLDPYKLNGVAEAVNRIAKALKFNEKVLIFGDYDADGVMATSTLYFCLKHYGIDAICTIPERDDGYGLNLDIVKNIKEKENISLIITVDCGVSDYDKVEEIKKMGIDVIVTDHHEPPEILPNTIVINPKIEGQEYGFTELCGAGVAYKLGYALIGELADECLDLVAVATVSDSMELVGENRNIVTEGLKLFNTNKIRPAIKYLLGENDKVVTAQTIAFSIAPKINAGGRMGDAKTSLDLFLSKSNAQISELTEKLKAYNVNRQVICDQIYREAKAEIEKTGANKDSVILIYKEGWKTGFIGIAASKLVDEYSRPVIVFAENNDTLKGSARSIDGINIFEIISSKKELLEAYGGHSQASGITVKKENFELLRKELNQSFLSLYGDFDFTKKIYADWKIEGKFSKKFAKEIELLGPFGLSNRKPLFGYDVESIKSIPLKYGSPHYNISTDCLEMLNFNGGNDVSLLLMPTKKTILFETNVSVFKNKESIKGFVKKIVPDYDFNSLKPYCFEAQLNNVLSSSKEEVLPLKNTNVVRGKGTLFAINDYKNLEHYPELKNLPVSMFVPEIANGLDTIVVSPTILPESYNNVFYLDTPTNFLHTNATCWCNFELSGLSYVKNIKTDREYLLKLYSDLLKFNSKTFDDFYSFYKATKIQTDVYTFVFALEVFKELGFVKIIGDLFKVDISVKNKLENSKIYNKICKIKSEL